MAARRAHQRSRYHALRMDSPDPDSTTTSFRVASALVARWWPTSWWIGAGLVPLGLLVGALVTISSQPPSMGAAAGLLAVPFLALIFPNVPTRLVIGRDGLVLRWLGRGRFLGFSDIASAAVYSAPWGGTKTMC